MTRPASTRLLRTVLGPLYRRACKGLAPCGLDSWLMEAYWRRHQGEYLQDIGHPHRKALIDRILKYQPMRSVLEMGCNAGPNLFLLAEKLPGLRLLGIDINPASVASGAVEAWRRGLSNIRLQVGRAESLREWPSRSVDVIVTDAVCIYLNPPALETFLMNSIRVARRGLVLCEWCASGPPPSTEGSSLLSDGHWIHDYAHALGRLVPPRAVTVSRFERDYFGDPEWRRHGAWIEADLRPGPLLPRDGPRTGE